MKSTRDFAGEKATEKNCLCKVYMRTRRMKLRTRRIKGGRLWWNNKNKSTNANKRDCKRWNGEECKYNQYSQYYYPGRTNIGRKPTFLHGSDELTLANWKEALPNYNNFNEKQWKQVYPEFQRYKTTEPPTAAETAAEGRKFKPNSNYERNPKYEKFNTKTRRRLFPEIQPYQKI